MPGKRVQFEEEILNALRLLAQDRMASFQELADEAFGDLLAKHGRAADLRSQLKKSAAEEPAASQPSRPPARETPAARRAGAQRPHARRPRGAG